MDYYLQHQAKEALQKLLTGFFQRPGVDNKRVGARNLYCRNT